MINCKMVFDEILHCIQLLMLLSLAIHEVEGITCDADICQARKCSYGFVCQPGFRPVARADNCGCCPACVETIDEGSECSPGPAVSTYANGSYTWNSFPPVCKQGTFCSKDGTYPVCKPLITCQADTCDSRRNASHCASKRTCAQGSKSVLYSDDCGCCSSCAETLDEGSACFAGPYATTYANGLYTWRDYQAVCKDGLYCVDSSPYPICIARKPAALCEANVCQFTRCASSLECLPGLKSVPRARSCGCCAACLETLDEGRACFPGPRMHIYANGSYAWSDYPNVCKEGLYCEKNVTHPVCKPLKPGNCAHRRELALAGGVRPGQYVPQCNPDGSYRAKQCGPGPECHCVNEQNIRIGEYSIPIWEAGNMTCLCAREHLLLHDGMMECTELGNFCEFGACSSGRVLSHTGMTSFLLMVACLRLLISDA